MSKNDGGPAFPETHVHGKVDRPGWMGRSGMTTRDYFASAAMQGFLAHENILAHAMTEKECELQFINAAAFAYRIADQMIKERDK